MFEGTWSNKHGSVSKTECACVKLGVKHSVGCVVVPSDCGLEGQRINAHTLGGFSNGSSQAIITSNMYYNMYFTSQVSCIT